MRRRRFLAVAGATAVAGCSSGSNGDGSSGDDAAGDGDPADDADASTGEQSDGTDESDSAGADESTDGTVGDPTPGMPVRGVSLSPRSYEDGDFQQFFERATTAGSIVRWAGDWAELGTEGGPPSVIAQLAASYGYEPMIDVGVYDAGRRELFRPLEAEQRDSYVEQARAFAAEYQPAYLGLGVETNFLASEEPDAFARFESLYGRARAAVADVSPDTAVYTVFQLEWLRGRRGGLWGPESGAGDDGPQWDLLDRFPGDYQGFTSYPGLVFREPSDVPDDYYTAVADRVDVPLAITETGWSATLDVEGWESDEAEQAAFVRRLFDLLEGVRIGPLVWLWLYEQGSENPAFAGTSLRRDDDTPRPAWDAWQSSG